MYFDNVKIVVEDFPNCRQKSFVVYSCDNEGEFWTIVLNGSCNDEIKKKAIIHELGHIINDDIHSELTVAEIENLSHYTERK